MKSARYLNSINLPLIKPDVGTSIQIWSAAVVSPELTKIILLAKEMNIRRARNYLAGLLVECYMRAETDHRSGDVISLIPIPSSTRANRQRGYRHSFELAYALRRQLLSRTDGEVHVVEALAVNRPVKDQSGLDRDERISNLYGAYSVVNSGLVLRKATSARVKAYLLDDLMTTGSSFLEGHRALSEAGIRTAGALVAGASAS